MWVVASSGGGKIPQGIEFGLLLVGLVFLVVV